jgi:hypothetical protein
MQDWGDTNWDAWSESPSIEPRIEPSLEALGIQLSHVPLTWTE